MAAKLTSRLFTVSLIISVIGATLLIATLWMLFLHICCGMLFMAVAMYSLVRGQRARHCTVRLGWFGFMGAVLGLFSYWALKVVFRPSEGVPYIIAYRPGR